MSFSFATGTLSIKRRYNLRSSRGFFSFANAASNASAGTSTAAGEIALMSFMFTVYKTYAESSMIKNKKPNIYTLGFDAHAGNSIGVCARGDSDCEDATALINNKIMVADDFLA